MDASPSLYSSFDARNAAQYAKYASTQCTPDFNIGITDEYHGDTQVKTPAKTQLKTPPQMRNFDPRKAGFDKVDKKRVAAIIKSLTDKSAHHQAQKQKWADRKVRHAAMKKKVAGIRACHDTLKRSRHIVDYNIIPEMEFRRLKGRVTVCVDFDCFYAAVEAMDDPSLVGKPHAVCTGDDVHSILATTSYEARALGVKGGIGTFIGKAICPELIVIPARMNRYAEISKMMEGVLENYDPRYCMGSLDEAFLDITHNLKNGVTAEQVVFNLRSDIKKATGLTVSAGCAPCLMIAKIGADMNKPNGQTMLLPEEKEKEREFCMKFIGSLPLIKIPGIGPVTESLLQDSFGFELVKDIYDDRATICAAFTPFKTNFLMRIVLGLGCPWTDQYYDSEFIRQGIGTGKTFDKTFDEVTLRKRLRTIAEALEKDVMHAGAVGGRTITVKFKTSNFEKIVKATTLPRGSLLCTADDFELFGLKILERNFPVELRKIGLKLHKLVWKKRPKESIKPYLKLVDESKKPCPGNDEFDEEWLENSLTKSQIQQARQRAKAFYDHEFCRPDAENVVAFKKSDPTKAQFKCPECSKCFKYELSLKKHLKPCQGIEDVKEKRIIRTKGENARISAYFKKIKSPAKGLRSASAVAEDVKGNGRTKREREGNVDEKDRTRKRVKKHEATGPRPTLTCPVCNIRVFKYHSSLNSHLDVCLAKPSVLLKLPLKSPVLLKLPLKSSVLLK